MPMCTDEYGEYPCSVADKFVLPLFDMLDASFIATSVKASASIVPWAGAAHLLALAALGGAALMVDLKLLGAGVKTKSVKEVLETTRPILLVALIAAVVSGSILALGELKKLYYSPPYWLKMATLFAAIAFTWGVRNRIINSEGSTTRFALPLWGGLILGWLAIFVFMSNWLARGAFILLLAGLFATVWRRRASLNQEGLMLSLAGI
ncbi:MAG: DUF6644 family protein [Pseudomonadota bacterium]